MVVLQPCRIYPIFGWAHFSFPFSPDVYCCSCQHCSSRVWVVCLWAFVGWCLELNDSCRNSKPIGWLWVFSKGRHLRVDESPRSRFGILWWSLWQFEGGDILHSMAFLFLVLNQKWLMLLCTIGFLEMIIVSELLWIMTKTWWFHEATTVFLQNIFELNLPISYSYVSRAHYFLLTASTVSHVWNYTASPKAIFWHLQVHLISSPHLDRIIPSSPWTSKQSSKIEY